MFIHMMKSKIHRATVTEADLSYVGSITIDEELIEKSDLYVGERVQVVNNNNGARFETYVIAGKRGSGIICINGAAARLAQVGDKVIIIAYCMIDKKDARKHEQSIVFVDDDNKIIEIAAGETHGDKK